MCPSTSGRATEITAAASNTTRRAISGAPSAIMSATSLATNEPEPGLVATTTTICSISPDSDNCASHRDQSAVIAFRSACVIAVCPVKIMSRITVASRRGRSRTATNSRPRESNPTFVSVRANNPGNRRRPPGTRESPPDT